MDTITLPPVDLYLNFEISSWKTQVPRTGFLACKNQFEIDFCSKNPVRNRLKIQFVELDFSEIKYRLTGGKALLSNLYTMVAGLERQP